MIKGLQVFTLRREDFEQEGESLRKICERKRARGDYQWYDYTQVKRVNLKRIPLEEKQGRCLDEVMSAHESDPGVLEPCVERTIEGYQQVMAIVRVDPKCVAFDEMGRFVPATKK